MYIYTKYRKKGRKVETHQHDAHETMHRISYETPATAEKSEYRTP